MNVDGRFVQRLRSLASFLAIPLGVVLLFLILAVITYAIDSAISKDLVNDYAVLSFLSSALGDRDSIRSLLGTIASALITITSITFSLLLVAVQQAAASFSNQILQQFRSRKTNQFYFGFFVGLSLYTLLTLATMRDIHHPLIGALVSIIMTVVALLLILVLIYTTIEQMRGSSVIDEIAENVRKAREKELPLLRDTRRSATPGLPVRRVHWTWSKGTVTSIDVAALSERVGECAPGSQLVLCATEGVYVGCGDPVAHLRSSDEIPDDQWQRMEKAIGEAVSIGSEPQLTSNPQVGLRQLATIAWNNTSAAVSNPHPPILICRAIRSIVWDWTSDGPDECEDSPIVYPDLSLKRALELLEAMGVASAESKQPQTLAELYATYAALLPRLSGPARDQVEEAVRLSLGALPEHLPTQRLNEAMDRLAGSLERIDSPVASKLRNVLRSEEKDATFRKEEAHA